MIVFLCHLWDFWCVLEYAKAVGVYRYWDRVSVPSKIFCSLQHYHFRKWDPEVCVIWCVGPRDMEQVAWLTTSLVPGGELPPILDITAKE